MIRKLILDGFGKFRHAEFDLAGMTLVYGPNEAGKTTFFDGLFQALCRPSETKKTGKVLKARYGAGRAARLVYGSDASLTGASLPDEAHGADGPAAGEGAPITDEEFMNLYAIREGDLKLEFDKGTEWLDKLKSRLFHGGLDPSLLAAEFEKRSSDSRSLTHNKELEKARDAAAQARKELETRRRERDSLLAREKSLADTEAELAETRKLLSDAAAEATRLDAQTQGEDRIALRQKWNGWLAKLEEWEAMEAAALALEPYRIDRSEEPARLAETTRKASAAVQAELGKIEQQADSIAGAKTERKQIREAKEAAGPRAAAAKRLGEQAKAALGSGSPGRFPLWSPISAAALFVLGLLAAWLSPGGSASILPPIAGALLGAGALFAGARARRISSRETVAADLSRWKDEWILAAGVSAGPIREIGTLEGFHRAMEAAAREREEWEGREADAERRLDGLLETSERLAASLASLKEGEEEARRGEREWAAGLNVSGAEEYGRLVARSAQLRSELPKRRAELESLAEGPDLQAFGREVRRRLQGLDEEGVPEKGLDQAALQRLRKQRQELQARRETAGKREKDLIDARARLAGEIRAVFGKLAEEMVAWEERLLAAEAEILAKETDKQAAALAREIFKGIGDGADLLLAGLSGEMQGMLARILPGNRQVSLMGLEDRQIQVQDAAGNPRSLDQLSTGTKHAMVLAAKLAMALKHRRGPGLLVLDEPFSAMDRDRETKALELLRDFRTRHGWQIILMTKDAELKAKALGLFPGAGSLDLASFR